MDMDYHPALAIVVDEPELRRSLAAYIGKRPFRVSALPSGAALRDLMRRDRLDLVILDLDIPDENGLSMLRWLRTREPVGVMLLAATREAAAEALALDGGGDNTDCMVKPVDARELVARSRALLRRMGHAAPDTQPAPLGPPLAFELSPLRPVPSVVRVGRCHFDTNDGHLRDEAGRTLRLEAPARRVLARLLQSPHAPVGVDELGAALRGTGGAPPVGGAAEAAAVDACISALRDPIEMDPTRPEVLRTLHGRGYMFTPAAA